MRASVLCVTHNNLSMVDDLLRGIEAQGDSIAEVSIVDNGSSDGTDAALERRREEFIYPLSVVSGENIGFASGVNAALDQLSVDCDALLVLNPDVVLVEGIVAKMLSLLECVPNAGIITAPLTLRSGEEDPASRRRLPALTSSVLYATLGRWTPKAARYNSIESNSGHGCVVRGLAYSKLEATTGALMLISPTFRTAASGIFDTDYWMYGEDLQLCADACDEGRSVLMLEQPGSIHVKGASSGLPRGRRSDRAFHNALYLYYVKNLRRNEVERVIVFLAIGTRFCFSRLWSIMPWH